MTTKPTRVVLETLCVLDDACVIRRCWCGAKDERHSRSAIRTHFLRRGKNDTGQQSMVGKHNPREKGRSASAQDGAGLCTTPMPQPLTQPSHAPPTKPLAQPDSLSVTKEA